ncbi:MAG: isoleucine--tRNA ligase [Pseudomonadota bacterium]
MTNDKNRDSQDGARDYKSTLFLPETDFPMRAGLPKKEPELLARWAEMGLYKRLREDAAGRPQFVLHDGPPYANGHLHTGHALNKILKDFVVRTRQMMGCDSNYVPGWDCHGLPIEWKVEEAYRAKGKAKRDVPVEEFRAACRAYAEKWVGIQNKEFQRLGIEGDWSRPYTTMAFAAEASIVEEFLKFVMSGAVYRGSKPVMWSPVEETALAEAEVEYADHVSPTIWVKFSVQPEKAGGGAAPEALADAKVVIWTTTPWTIPGNRAVCYSKRIAYGLYEVTEAPEDNWALPGDKIVLADALAEDVKNAARIEGWTRVCDVTAEDLEGLVLKHPFNGEGYDFDVPMLAGDHVTDEAGTGFVHTAPGHGADDYLVWRMNGYTEIPETVGPDGAYFDDVPLFGGQGVLVTEGKKKGKDGPANSAVIDKLVEKNALLARGRLTHSYPHSWRSKAPLIFRNTPQWFVSMDRQEEGGTLREKALAAISDTKFYPPQGENRIRAMVADRPDWLLSRQRAWGVPLAMFVSKSGEILKDEAVNARIIAAVKDRGADAWFETPAEEFLGDAHNPDDYEKVTDILDVWFDSGSTHSFVLEQRPDLKWPADVYLEGSDQHRGWFQSSLLEACGTRGRAPYDAVVTHGFLLDEEGRKMSKSLGNSVDPEQVIKQSGAEILRIWVANSDYTEDLRIGPEILKSATDSYRKLRNTVRYLLGALSGFDESERVSVTQMPELERYMLHSLHVLDEEVRAAYEAYDYRGAFSKLFHFCTVDLSAFYFDIRKDSLYCDRPDDPRRKACRTVMDEVFSCLTAWLAPICCFTMEEAWLTRNPSTTASVHLRQFPVTPEAWRDEALAGKWSKIRTVRRVVTGALEIERREKRIGSSLEAAPTIYVSDADLFAAVDEADLAEIGITSSAILDSEEGPANAFRLDDVSGVAVLPGMAEGAKCRRCWRILPEVGAHPVYKDLCYRCADAVAAHGGKNQ